MYNMRRIGAWVLTICVLFGCATLVWADEERELVRFNTEAVIAGTSNLKGLGFSVSAGEDGIYETPDTMSAQWTQIGAGDHYDLKLTEQAEDWSGYDYLSIRAYSPEASGAAFNLTLFEGGGTYGWVGGKNYSRFNLVADWSGWKTVNISLADFQGTLNLSAVNGIGFTNGSWGAEFAPNATIYISRISLVKQTGDEPGPAPTPEVNYDEELGMLTIAEFAAAADVAKGSCLTVDTEITRMHDISAHWADVTQIMQINLPSDKGDLSTYQFFNQWVYSAEATNDTIYLIFFDANNAYFSTTFTVNWKGWKLMSVPFPPSNASRNPDITNIKNVTMTGRFFETDQPSAATKLNFDKLWMSREEVKPPASAGVFPAADENKAAAGDTVAILAYNNYLSAQIAEDAVSVTENGQPLENFTVSAQRNQLRVAFPSMSGCRYEVSAAGDKLYDVYGQLVTQATSVEFTTRADGVTVGALSFAGESGVLNTIPSGGTVQAEITVENQTTDTQKAALFAAIYSEDGAMEGSALSEAVALAPGGQQTVSVSVSKESYSGCSVAAFLINPDTFAPISDRAFYLTESGMSDSAAVTQVQAAPQIYSDANAALDANGRLNAACKIAGNPISMTLLLVRDDEGNRSMLIPVFPETDGTVAYSYPMGRSNEPSGKYTAAFIGRDGRAETASFFYADLQMQEQFAQSVATAATLAEMTTVVKENQKLFFDGEPETNEISHLAATLLEQKPYTDYTEIMETCEHAREVLIALNEKNWSHYSAYFRQEEKFLFAERTAYDALLALSNDKQAAALIALEKQAPFVSFADLRSKLAACVESAKDGSVTLPSGGSGGSGGGGGGSSSKKSAEFIVPEVAPLPIENEPRAPFIDLASDAWAEADITALYRAGIVSPAEDGCFRPSDLVRREEWIKLLVEAFGLGSETANCDYTDVSAADWFYPYVAAASEKGIVNGYDDNSFGSGDNVTRQDMAVLAYRTIQLLGKQVEAMQESATFADAEQIGEYAAEAVSVMQRAGILNGMEDGSFQPNGFATRAQAAALLNRLIQRAV